MQIAVFIGDKRESGTVCDTLRARGHACVTPAPREAVSACSASSLVLADAGRALALLPDLLRLRHEGARLPLLLIANAADQAAVGAALAAGADDYLLRPLRRGELIARVAILLARFHPAPPQAETYGAYTFDLVDRRVGVNGEEVALTEKEFELALLFFRHLGRPLSRAYLHEAVWPGLEDTGRSVDTHVSRVRSKLGLRPERGFRLAPVYSFGYRLEQLGLPAR